MDRQQFYIDCSGWTQEAADHNLEKFYTQLYLEQIDLDWDSVHAECEVNTEDDGDSVVGRCFIGTVFDLMPSGKYWNFLANNNVSRVESIKDIAYIAALMLLADDHNMFLDRGNDPCDMFLVCEV